MPFIQSIPTSNGEAVPNRCQSLPIKTIGIFNSIPASAPFLASFLAPFWIPFGVPFGSPFGVPATDRFVRKHKENKAFWAFDVSPERSFRGLFWASFRLPFWDPFGWSFRAARGDGNIAFFAFSYFQDNYSFQFNYGGSQLDRNNDHSITVDSSFPSFQDN